MHGAITLACGTESSEYLRAPFREPACVCLLFNAKGDHPLCCAQVLEAMA